MGRLYDGTDTLTHWLGCISAPIGDQERELMNRWFPIR